MREIIFNKNIKTFIDWELILTSMSVPPPEVKTHYIQTDYSHGFIDLSESVNNTIFYGSRQCVFKFDLLESNETRNNTIEDIMNKLHGKDVEFNVPNEILSLRGRATVGIDRINQMLVKVEISILTEPFFFGEQIIHSALNVNATTFNNNGTIESPYLLTIKPKSTVTSLTVQINGKAMEIKTAIGSNENITIDSKKTEVKVGTKLVVVELVGTFGKMINGTNTITTSTLCDITIKFEERYL